MGSLGEGRRPILLSMRVWVVAVVVCSSVLAIGASVGAWLAFLIRRPVLGFTDLVQLDDDLLNPVTRVVFTIVLSLVIGLLFWTGMVAIKVGGFSTEFENNGLTALLIGAFCGLASRALATAVSRRAEDFAGNVGGTAGFAGGGGKFFSIYRGRRVGKIA